MARLTGDGSVESEPSLTVGSFRRGELFRDEMTTTEVHFVGRLPLEREVRERVMLVDEESNEPFDGLKAVEVVQEKPLVLERSPESFNRRI